MKIIHAPAWYLPESIGGMEVYVAGLVARQRAMGHAVLVAIPCLDEPAERISFHEGTPVYHYPMSSRPSRAEILGFEPVRGAERLHAWLAREKPDVFHAHYVSTTLGVSELRAAKAAGARVVLSMHTPALGYTCRRGTLMRWGERQCDGVCEAAKCAACYLHGTGMPKPLALSLAALPPAVSERALLLDGSLGTALGMSALIARQQARQRELFGIADSVVVLTEWARAALLANGAPPGKIALNRLGMSQTGVTRKAGPERAPAQSPVKIGYLGRFDAIKGVRDLARAVAALPRHIPVRVEFRGPVRSTREKRMRQELESITKADGRVTFAPAVAPDDAPRVLAEYDALCCPSLCVEGGPTVAIEAMAVGTPVIGTRIGGLAELVCDGLNGRLIAPGDWRALVLAIEEVALHPASTLDAWRRNLPATRSMDAIAADYARLYDAATAPAGD